LFWHCECERFWIVSEIWFCCLSMSRDSVMLWLFFLQSKSSYFFFIGNQNLQVLASFISRMYYSFCPTLWNGWCDCSHLISKYLFRLFHQCCLLLSCVGPTSWNHCGTCWRDWSFFLISSLSSGFLLIGKSMQCIGNVPFNHVDVSLSVLQSCGDPGSLIQCDS
jgi:hypothetical protein